MYRTVTLIDKEPRRRGGYWLVRFRWDDGDLDCKTFLYEAAAVAFMAGFQSPTLRPRDADGKPRGDKMNAIEQTMAYLLATMQAIAGGPSAIPRLPTAAEIEAARIDLAEARAYHDDELTAEYGAAARDPYFDEAKGD